MDEFQEINEALTHANLCLSDEDDLLAELAEWEKLEKLEAEDQLLQPAKKVQKEEKRREENQNF